MRSVTFHRPDLDRMVAHARATYPEECCGFLFTAEADADRPDRPVQRVAPAANEQPGERRRRFVISPQELLAAETSARARGEVVSGFYHSHPDHPARPSQFDQDHARPWYCYVVLGVTASSRPPDVHAFELDSERGVFGPVPLTSVPHSAHEPVAPLSPGLGRGEP